MNMETILVSALVSFITSFIVFFVKKSYEDYLIKERFASALLAEIDMLFNSYTEKLKDKLAFYFEEHIGADGHPVYLQGTMKVDSSCFVVYDHNSDKLGYFDIKTINEIIVLYNLARGHLCSINTWNDMAQRNTDPAEIKRYKQVLHDEYTEIAVQVKIAEKCLREEIDKSLWRKIKKNKNWTKSKIIRWIL